MDRIVIGRLTPEERSERNLEPLDIELVGYNLADEEVSETFRFRPLIPAGAQLEIIRHTLPNGNVPLAQVVDFVEECVLAEDLESFKTFLHRADVMIESDTITGLYRELTEFYSARPTRPRSGSASTGSPAKRTSRANARSAASRSKKSRST